jgi:hypothetical protein
MSFYPTVKPDDVLVEPENIRWVVRTISTTQEQRTIITQELQLKRIETTDIEYAIPLELGVPIQNLFFTSARNYSNPTTLTNPDPDDLDYPGIYSLYPPCYSSSRG